jgi:hypothetical protein
LALDWAWWNERRTINIICPSTLLLVPLWRNRRTICPNPKAIGATERFLNYWGNSWKINSEEQRKLK